MLVGLLIGGIAAGGLAFMSALVMSLPLWMAVSAYVLAGMTVMILGGPLLAVLAIRISSRSDFTLARLQVAPIPTRR